jgi:hypothetical protein
MYLEQYKVMLVRPPIVLSVALWFLAFVVAVGGETTKPRVVTGEESHEGLQEGFSAPAPSFRPWVYASWINGNITREGITADLEAMEKVGIGGLQFLEIGMGVPRGPVDYMSPEWKSLFKHMATEASRLGLKINIHNGAGWNGSGGPWITPALSMQKVVFSEIRLEGPKEFRGTLPQPETKEGYYRDIAVLAFPTPSDVRIDNIQGKASFTAKRVAALPWPDEKKVSPRDVIDPSAVIDLTPLLKSDGSLHWTVPEGRWTLLRVGHTSTGKHAFPAADSAQGLECDKLSREAVEWHFANLAGQLIDENGTLGKEESSLWGVHIDSWECGSQNWTPLMKEEFKKRRGYDLTPYLPALSGYVLGGIEISERFLWDFRKTISEMLVENYAGRMRELAAERGLKLSIQAYGHNPSDNLPYAAEADEPQGEFWVGLHPVISKEMPSAGHVYGKNIISAEAFTSLETEKWLQHPGSIKARGDEAFCKGYNRFVIHRYAMQPWLDRFPGITYGPYGLHYERTQTWWEHSKPWHDYLARCQYLLRQGRPVADICYVQSENPPQSSREAGFNGYEYDYCPPEAVLNRLSVKDGCLVTPEGVSYKILVLADSERMTPELLARVKELVSQGATVVGSRPRKSPSLVDYPECDAKVADLASELWGDGEESIVKRRVGKGMVISGVSPEDVLRGKGIGLDFCADGDPKSPFRYAHRQTDDGMDIYFFANTSPRAESLSCVFRVKDKIPELWNPEDGTVKPTAVFDANGEFTSVPLRLQGGESVFVIFRPGKLPEDRIVAAIRNDKVVHEANFPPPRTAPGFGNFSLTAWVKPEKEIEILPESTRGVFLKAERNDLIAAEHGGKWGFGHAGSGLSVGRNGVSVFEHADGSFTPTLSWTGDITDWTHLALVYEDGTPRIYINGKPAHTGLKSRFSIHSSHGSRPAFVGQFSGIRHFERTLSPEEIMTLASESREETTPQPGARDLQIQKLSSGTLHAEVWTPGHYFLRQQDGKKREFSVESIPAPIPLDDDWEVSFPPDQGAPEKVALDRLQSLSRHPESGVRFFSGTAKYRKNFQIPPGLLEKGNRLYLDLGKVAVAARVTLNGRDLGVLWKSPYRVEVTPCLTEGENELEVEVANLWPNRMIGDEWLADDAEHSNGCKIIQNWKPDLKNGTLLKWPQWVLDGKPSPTGRITFTSWKLWKKDDELVDSGLLGPVRIIASRSVSVPSSE